MKRVLARAAFVLAILFVPLSVHAQDSSATGWKWPERDVREALSYIRLVPQDLALRSDYVPRDAWRLALVDQAMTQPQSMPGVMRDFAFARSEKERSDSRLIRLRCRDIAVNLSRTFGETRYDTPSINLKGIGKAGLTPHWTKWFSEAVNACADTTRIDRILKSIRPEQRGLFLDDALLLVIEDAADRAKPAEVLDSIQRDEDTIAAHMAALAAQVRWWDGVLALSFVVDERILSMPLHNPISADTKATDTMIVMQTQIGTVIVGTRGNDIYTGNPVAVLDPGGDDEYRLDPQTPGRARIIADWSGNDLYEAPEGRSLGCGFWSWGLLIDQSGNDTYRGGNFTMGAGWFGVGALVDLGGRDIYEGDTYTQGAGGWGIGMLYDAGGDDDRYNGCLHSQGFGFSAGSGVLLDDGGDDVYFAGGKYEDILRYTDHYLSLSQGFAYGMRPHFSGGLGLLIDLYGDDTYTADIFGQGCSYWWGFGGLYDARGNDQYTAFQYAQGSATHMTAGCLFDEAGNDAYTSKGVSQGCGHDWSPGVLIDAAGNDRYACADLSQAAGSANGVGVLIDGAGDDLYTVKDSNNTQGYGNPRRDYGSVGLFLDLGGTDKYEGAGADARVWLSRSLWGVGVDADSAWHLKAYGAQ